METVCCVCHVCAWCAVVLCWDLVCVYVCVLCVSLCVCPCVCSYVCPCVLRVFLCGNGGSEGSGSEDAILVLIVLCVAIRDADLCNQT